MLGKALDFYIPDVPLESIRDAGLRLQRGGVGFYPSSGAPFIHMDVGSVRHWPRVPEAQLARIMSKSSDHPPGLQQPGGAESKTKAPAVVAARNVRDEDEDAEVVVTRPAQRGRVTASVAPQAPQQTPSRRPFRCRSRARARSPPSRRRPVSISPPPPRSRCACRRGRNRVSPSRVSGA